MPCHTQPSSLLVTLRTRSRPLFTKENTIVLLPTLAVPPNTPSAPFRRVTAVAPVTVAVVRASATDQFLSWKVLFPDAQAG